VKKKKPTYLSPEDFPTDWEFDIYLMAIAVNALDPSISLDHAQDALVGFACYHGETEAPLRGEDVILLVNDMKAGPGPAPEGMH
jgi:hypothetical protein